MNRHRYKRKGVEKFDAPQLDKIDIQLMHQQDSTFQELQVS